MAAAWSLPAVAQPDLSRKPGPTIADRGSAFYRFERFQLRSADGERAYRITMARPQRSAPESGFPVIYLLDGNAALAALDESLLQTLDRGYPPVIVAIGYDTDLRFDVRARAYDYTPPLPAGQEDEEGARGRKGGGADVFLDLLAHQVMPAVSSRVSVNAGQQTLWGHSYGGLLVLHALFTRSQLFHNYVAASPSLWWQHGVILQEEKRFAAQRGTRIAGAMLQPEQQPERRLWVMAGSAERRESSAGSGTPAAARASLPADAAPALVARLAALNGIEAFFLSFPGLAHGPMLPASMGPALRIAAGIAADDAE